MTHANTIEISHLSRRFGERDALRDVDLTIGQGKVFGLVGTNGAGKTTLIRHVMGLLKPQSGRVSVFGGSPVDDPVGVLSRIGYMSETADIPRWMRVDQLMNFTRAFYPNWDDAYARELVRDFELETDKVLMTLSRGQQARTALLLALAHRPDLLVLDEPSSGLDPLVRRDILRAVIRTVADDGRTVLFSSHLLDEVERVADEVAIIQKGEILLQGSVDSFQQGFHKVAIHFKRPRERAPKLKNAYQWQGNEHQWSMVFAGDMEQLRHKLEAHEGDIVESFPLNLSDIFIALVERPTAASGDSTYTQGDDTHA